MRKQIKTTDGIKIVSSTEELDALGLSLTQMRDAYNDLTVAQISKFSDRKTACRRLFDALDEAPKAQKGGKETDRDRMRAFLTKGKVFTIHEVAELLGTSDSNANTGVQLLKTRPGKHHNALVLSKMDDHRWKVEVAP